MESIIKKMVLIRRVEEEIIKRYHKQLMRLPVHLSIGQEAIAVGVCHHLKSEDKIFSTHRSHAHYLAKGGSLEKMALEMHGKIGGCMDGRGGSMHLMDTNIMSIPIVASAIPLAVGAALANRINGNNNIVVCFFGDAAVEEGVFHESMNFASLMQLPIIFVCENNEYSVDTHISKRQSGWLTGHLSMYNIRKIKISGHNVFSIANLFESEIRGIKSDKNGPLFVIMETGRSHVHCGVDKEFELKKDPLDVTKDYDDTEIMAKIIQAFDVAELAALPIPDMASRYVYA